MSKKAQIVSAVSLVLTTVLWSLPRHAHAAAEDSTLDLNQILAHAAANIQAFRSGVPNVYCTEHAVARRKIASTSSGTGVAVPGGEMPVEHSASVENSAETTSLFRLKRLDEPTARGIFEESRIVQKATYSADAPGYEEIATPELLYGVFSNGLNILAPESQACFHFDLRKVQAGKPIVIDFRDLPASQRAQGCPAAADGKGTIRLDPATMHVTEIERNIARQQLVDGIEGSWDWKESYAPVTLKTGTFWLPASITSRSMSADQRRIWTFAATYRDYHLFFSSTRILPGN